MAQLPARTPAARRSHGLVTLVALAASALGCSPEPPAELAVRDAWIRPVAAGQTTAAYLTVAGGTADDRLLGGAFDGAAATELHETLLEDDMVRMVPRPEGLVVPAGGVLVLAPRGAHLMLVDLARDLVEGEAVPLVLAFEAAGAMTVTAEVRLGP